ncbi:MAG: TetR/AcrR family transcriptional regulator [Victivallales bacterium]|jgi:AcrR family transcriptional regulator
MKKSDRTRERILKAAIKEFSRNGFNGARVDVIAKRAGINKERLYAYFGGKSGLYKKVLLKVFSGIIEAEGRLLSFPIDRPESLSHALVDVYLDFLTEHPEFWRLLIFENLDGGKNAEVLPCMSRPSFEHIQSVYKKGCDKGIFPSDVSFKSYLYSITALVFFAHSNRITLARTLGLDLNKPSAVKKLLHECLNLYRIPK